MNKEEASKKLQLLRLARQKIFDIESKYLMKQMKLLDKKNKEMFKIHKEIYGIV